MLEAEFRKGLRKGRARQENSSQERTATRQSCYRSISVVHSLFLPCSRSPVALDGLMVGGGWKSIALNNEPQGNTLSLSRRSPRSGAVSHPLVWKIERERERETRIEGKRQTRGEISAFSLSLYSSSFNLLRLTSPLRPYWTLFLLVARTEVFVSSPSPQLCYENP